MPSHPCHPPHPDETAVELVAVDGGFASGLYLPLNDVRLGRRTDVQTVLNGNLALSWAESTFSGTVDDTAQHVERFDASIDLSGALTLELAVTTAGSLSGAVRLATVPLPSITVGAVVASPFVRATMRLAGTADAGTRVSLVAPFRLGTAHVDAGGQQTADLSEPPRLLPEVGGPDPANAGSVEAELDLEVALAFLVSVGGIPIGGPVVGHSVGAVLRVDPGADPWWSADGAFEVLGGWTFADPVTGLPLVEELETLFRDERPIASAEGPLPAVTTSSRWSRVFDISNSDHTGGAVVDGDGLIVVDDDGAPWVAGLDGLGVPRWQSRVPAGEFGLIGAPTAVTRLGDGAILMAGNGASLGVDRYDPAGTALWRRKLSLPESGSALTCTGIVPGALGGALLAGRAAHDASTLAPYLATLGADGTLERAIELDMGAGSSAAEIAAIAATPAGEILAVGSVEVEDVPDGDDATISGTSALVLRLGPDGTPIAAFALGDTRHQVAQSIAVHPDGSYAIGGVLSFETVWIAAFAADDTPRWSWSYQSRPDVDGNGENAAPTALASLNGDGLLVCGHIGSSDVDAWIMRLDADGMPVWLKSYISDDQDELTEIIALEDGLVAFGSTGVLEDVSSFEDLWILRTSVDGRLDFTSDSGLATVSTAVQWQPVVGHTVHPLAPVGAATDMSNEEAPFGTEQASVVGELITT